MGALLVGVRNGRYQIAHKHLPRRRGGALGEQLLKPVCDEQETIRSRRLVRCSVADGICGVTAVFLSTMS